MPSSFDPSRPQLQGARRAVGHTLGGLLAGLALSAAMATPVQSQPDLLADDDAGVRLPAGFDAEVIADNLGRGRHLTVRANGDIYLRLRALRDGAGVVALRDTDGDGRPDRRERFDDTTGTGIALYDNHLYLSSETAVYRYAFAGDELVPKGARETIVSGFPEQRSHAAKPLAFDDAGHLYVVSGAPSNACQDPIRTAGVPGQRPCPELARGGGIWRFDAGTAGQDQMRDGVKVATKLRHAVGMDYHPSADAIVFMQHGRDQLSALWPEHYTDKDNAELPAEEFHKVRYSEGKPGEYGWPYTYYDPIRDTRMIAPEYGGDGETPSDNPDFQEPLVAFPAHWAPNAVLVYTGEQFPARYQNGAFIAFHGSWNRAPLPQQGYNVAFVPFADGTPTGSWERFVTGFPGVEPVASPGEAMYRPTGLAMGPDGSLYVSDSVQGRIWRIRYTGQDEEPSVQAAQVPTRN